MSQEQLERRMALMRALIAAQAALFDVIDDMHNSKQVLKTMIGRVAKLTHEILEEG